MPHRDIYRDGRKLVSVTELMSILNKPFLDKWRENLCAPGEGICGFVRGKQLAEEAGQLGKDVHTLMEHYFKKSETFEPISEEAVKWGDKMIHFCELEGIEPYLITPEESLIDEASGLAGSPDLVALHNKQAIICDFKVKNSLDDMTGLQGFGYRYLIQRKTGEKIDKMLILWGKKRTKSYIVEAKWLDLTEWEEDWKALVRLWNRTNPTRRVVIHE